MYYIAHGSTRTLENTSQQFDARTYQWKNLPQNVLEFEQYNLKEKELEQEWFENNCHPNGVFFCNRCYRKHNVPDNFDLLCDGCISILKEYHSIGFSFDFTERFNEWYTNIPSKVLNERMELRQLLDDVFKSNSLVYQDKEVLIGKVPSKNNFKVEVYYVEDSSADKNKRFLVDIRELQVF